jgi:hypothetical protein
MERLPSSIFPREVRFAHIAFAFRLAEIYVPFVDGTDVRNIVQQLLDSASSAPVGTTLGYPVIRRCSFSLADSP